MLHISLAYSDCISNPHSILLRILDYDIIIPYIDRDVRLFWIMLTVLRSEERLVLDIRTAEPYSICAWSGLVYSILAAELQ